MKRRPPELSSEERDRRAEGSYRGIREPRRPRMLDLYCKEGGAAMGYWRAGWDVVGVDIEPQPRYPFEFHQDDAISVLYDGPIPHAWVSTFDAIHASPPCQAHTRLGTVWKKSDYAERHVDLVDETRDALRATGLPWIMENVEGAPMPGAIKLCGTSFGLRLRRHRLFESSHLLMSMPCRHDDVPDIVGLYGHFGPKKSGGAGGCTIDEAREIIDMPWASRDGIAQAIPPAYTEYLGCQLLDVLSVSGKGE